ncbi:HoxN/HupN/NixA family nickel/cobalt transporter [Neobacillus massiliamazoniensis]|uniref:HoxN/HupN/NixA family nickel/cobalt transporter n=1 Tax=Neobacillus massiliamazoniensis TaxID=1499688 RepID=UPI000B893710
MEGDSLQKKNWIPYGVVVLLLHVIGLIFLWIGARNNPLLLGMAFLAYTLGLRHAFDADHIAAIDNTVRKLVQQKKNPIGVGFFFSLGHSSVVFLMAVLLSISVQWAQKELPHWQEMGGTIGTIVSGCFLLFIGILNAIILFDLQKVFFKMRKGTYNDAEVEELLLNRGFIARFTGPLFKLINKSWHVYPIGFLFGLGFDTASEVALLAISAGAAKNALPLVGILSLPILFAAGMSLMDTADGIFMTNAYNWAFSTPIRKVYYNLTVTAISVIAALLIGMIELVQVLSEKLNISSGGWKWIVDLDISWMGYLLVILFLFSWGMSFVIWKVFNIEERWNRS